MMARRHPKEPGKVRLMMGNGGGHEPAVIGWVGQGMLDLNVVGDVFTAPSGKMIYQGISRLAETGPVILFVQNHAGDVMNAELAMDMAEDLPVKSVLFYDDIASAPKGQEQERRGMGGMLFYAKICGALAGRGALQDEIIAMFEAVRDRTRTLSVAINGGTHPVTGLPISGELGENEIEIGMGVHGEGGANARGRDSVGRMEPRIRVSQCWSVCLAVRRIHVSEVRGGKRKGLLLCDESVLSHL